MTSSIVSAFTNPSSDGPVFHFNDGQLLNGGEEYNPNISSIAPLSAQWSVTQWMSDAYFNPLAVQVNTATDPLLGKQLYSWTSSTGNSAFGVFGGPGDYTYRMMSQNVELQDVYLQNYAAAPANYTFDKQITFTANERISAVETTGGGYAQAQNDVVVVFNDMRSATYNARLATVVAFIQSPLATTRNTPQSYDSFDPTTNSVIYNTDNSFTTATPLLPWAADAGPLYSVSIDLNSALAGLMPYLVGSKIAGVAASDYQTMSNWSLEGFYVGIEASPGGGGTMDVQNPLISRNTAQSFTLAQATGAPMTIQPRASFAEAAASQSASVAIAALVGQGFAKVVLNAGVTGTGPMVGVLGGDAPLNYGTLTAMALPSTVQALLVNNAGDTYAGNSRFMGAETVISSAGNLHFTDNGASTTILTATGTNAIGFTAQSVNATFLGDGANTITIATAAGSTSVYGTAQSADTIVGTATAKGGIVYTSAAGATAFINPGSANVTVFGAAGQGAATVFGASHGASGRLTVVDGSGAYEGGSAGLNVLTSSAAGATTLMGGGNGDLLQARGAGDVLYAGAGASTLDGSYSSGGAVLVGSSVGSTLIYASQTVGDTIVVTNSTVRGTGYTGAFIDLHTGPNSLLRSLNNSVASTIIGGQGAGGAQFATVGDFITGLDKLVLVSASVGAPVLSSGSMAVPDGSTIAYSRVVTSNGSCFTFYNATLTGHDIVMR